MVVVMENHFDSIVVDNTETVKRCIDYLKEHKWHPMTFLPLDSISAQAPDQRSAHAGCFSFCGRCARFQQEGIAGRRLAAVSRELA